MVLTGFVLMIIALVGASLSAIYTSDFKRYDLVWLPLLLAGLGLMIAGALIITFEWMVRL